MKTLLVALNHWDATSFGSDHWATATWFFGGGQKLLTTIATIAVITPSTDTGERYVETIVDTAEELIGRRIDDPDEQYPPPAITDDQRLEVVQYLLDCHKAIRPYLPNTGTLHLHGLVSSDSYDDLYLIIKHHEEDDLDTVKPTASIRVGSIPG